MDSSQEKSLEVSVGEEKSPTLKDVNSGSLSVRMKKKRPGMVKTPVDTELRRME